MGLRENGAYHQSVARLHFIYQRKLSRSGQHQGSTPGRSLSPPEGEEWKESDGTAEGGLTRTGGAEGALEESADGLRAKSGARRNPGIPGSACALSRWIDRPRARVPFPPL